MKRVLVFGRFYDPNNLGGVETAAQNLITLLTDYAEFINLVPSKTPQGFETKMPCGVPVIATPSWNVDGSLAISPALILKARAVFKSFQPDLIHLHFPDPMSHLASLFLPRRTPRVISYHADIVRQKKMLMLYRPFLNRALKTAAAITVATPHHKNSPFLAGIPDSKIHVIPYGTPPRFFTADANEVAALKEKYKGKKIIFTLGRHVSYKGFDILIRAMAQLSNDTILLLGGQGPLTESLKETAKNSGVAERVFFLDAIADAALPAFYHACDVFCLPSVTKAEAFGLVQLEAMATAKPVVSTRLGTGVDFVNQNAVTGFTPPPGDVDALAKALKEILENNDLRKTFGVAALKRVQNEFSMDQMKNKTKNLYDYILRNKK